jgi:hypothetical protein
MAAPARRSRETHDAGRPDPDANAHARRLFNACRLIELERSLCIGDAGVEQVRRLAGAVERGEADLEVLAERVRALRRLQDAALALMRTELGDDGYEEAYRAAGRQNEEATRILTRPALRPVRVTPPQRRRRVTIPPGRPCGQARPRRRRSHRGPRADRAGPDDDPPAGPVGHAARHRSPLPPLRPRRSR